MVDARNSDTFINENELHTKSRIEYFAIIIY